MELVYFGSFPNKVMRLCVLQCCIPLLLKIEKKQATLQHTDMQLIGTSYVNCNVEIWNCHTLNLLIRWYSNKSNIKVDGSRFTYLDKGWTCIFELTSILSYWKFTALILPLLLGPKTWPHWKRKCGISRCGRKRQFLLKLAPALMRPKLLEWR